MAVRQYQPGDEHQIQSLFKKTFNHDRPLSSWKWKFIDNPKQKEPFILVYEEDEKILGHISLWLTEGYINGKKSTIGLRVDTMVDPEARGKGIYKKLNQVLIEEASDKGIDYIYGFPAAKAKELFIRYTEASHLTDMPRWMLVQKPFSLLSSKVKPLRILKPLDNVVGLFKRKSTSHSDVNFQQVTRCDESFDQLAEQTRHLQEGMIVRDSTYLNWRYFDHPTNDYEMFASYRDGVLQGYIVLNRKEKSFKNGLIIDWLALDENSWGTLLNKAISELDDVDVIQSWALSHTSAAQVMKKNGFVHKDSPMPLVGKVINKMHAELNASNKWYITPGDVDSF